MPARRPHKNRQDTKKTRQAPFHLHFSSQIVVSVLRLDFPHCRRVLTTATRLVRIGRPVHFRPSDMPGNAAQSKSKFAGKNVGAMPPYLPSRANLRSGAEGKSESSVGQRTSQFRWVSFPECVAPAAVRKPRGLVRTDLRPTRLQKQWPGSSLGEPGSIPF